MAARCLTPFVLAAALAGCVTASDGEPVRSGPWSLRESLGLSSGASMQAQAAADIRAQRIAEYQAQDAARVQAGLPALWTTIVTIYAGEAKMPVGGGIARGRDWRPLGVASAVVTECGSAILPLPRADKVGQGSVTVSRVQGLLYFGSYPAGMCDPPSAVAVYPTHGGRYPLDVQGVVRGGVVDIQPWGGYPAPGYGRW